MSRQENDGVSRRTFLKHSATMGAALSVGGAGLSTVLSACGSTQGGAGGKIQLNFWDMIWGPPAYVDAAKKLVQQFNQQHSNIQVVYQSIPWTNWYQTFSTAIGSGTAPDISTGAGYQAVQFYDSGAILPIDDVIAEWQKAGKLDDFQSGTTDILKYNGHYVALPWGIDIRIPFYRKDYFQQAGLQPPANWADLKAAAKKLTGKGSYGLVASSDTGGTHYLYELILNNGGGLFATNKKVDLLNVRDAEAIQYFSSIVKDGSINPASTGYQSTDAVKSFGQGNAAMIISNPGLKSQLPTNILDKVGILTPLVGPHGDKGTVYWINNIMLYKQSNHPDEAKVFLKWWSENQKALWTQGHSTQLPARKSFASDPYFKNDQIINNVIENWLPLGKTTATLSPAIFPQLNAIEGQGVMQTLMQDLLQGKDPQQAMQTANSGMQNIMTTSGS